MKRPTLHTAAYLAILFSAALSLGADGCSDGDVPIGGDDAGMGDAGSGSDAGSRGDGGTYEPCADKSCGDSCTICAPDDPDCAETAVEKFCQPDGSCSATVPECSGGCPEGQQQYYPGCEPSEDFRELPSAGCYQPCTGADDGSCPDGTTCDNAWIDPCAGSACLACGGEQWLCLPEEGGDDCGGIAGLTCDADEYCDYPDGSYCGGDDSPGTCRPKPDACTEDCPRVCGCDGETYCNSCIAAASGTDVLHDGPCETSGGREPVSGYCYRTADHSCDTDADCTTGGCGSELCYNPAVEELATSCDCTMPTDADCGCVDGSCVWYQ